MTLFAPSRVPSKHPSRIASPLSKSVKFHTQLQKAHSPRHPIEDSPLVLSLSPSLTLEKMTEANAASFEAFLDGWMVRQRNYLDELLSAQQHHHEQQDDDRRELISRVLSHYQQYYEEKSRIAQRNILLVFSPTWFSSLERTFLWITGFKPGILIQLANTALNDLSEDQRQRISELSHETKLEERALNDELAKIHESVAAPPLVEMARSHGRLCLNNSLMAEEGGDGGGVPSTLKIALENLVAEADTLRMNTALKVMKILRPAQAVKALVAVAELQLRIRTWGLEKDAQVGGVFLAV